MAQTEIRPQRGAPPTYRVKWRTGGGRNGRWDWENFDDAKEAERFKKLIDAHRNTRPSDDTLSKAGFGYLVDGGDVMPAEPIAPGPAAAKTFEECAREYVDDLETVSEETRRKYLERLDRHVFPVLGPMAMAAISIGDCKRWQKGLQANGLSRKTIANIRGESVSPTFERACLPGDDGEPPLRGYNPIKGLALPKAIPYTRQIFDDTDEAEILITAAYIIDPEIGDLLVTELSVGFRWGEIAGLPIRAMNKRKQTLQVFQVARRYGNEWRIEPMPKTEDGFRQVPVTDPVWEMLQRRADGRKPNDFVFYPPSGSSFWLYHNFYKKWAKILELAQAMGFPKHMTPHGLRATLLTWLSSEVDLETLRNIAGHKEVITTYKFYVKNNTRQFGAVKAAVTPLVEVVSSLLRPRMVEPQQPGESERVRVAA